MPPTGGIFNVNFIESPVGVKTMVPVVVMDTKGKSSEVGSSITLKHQHGYFVR